MLEDYNQVLTPNETNETMPTTEDQAHSSFQRREFND